MSKGIHAGAPWRKVVHIADRVGPHGGEYWALTLDECGHTAFRNKPKFRFFDAVGRGVIRSAPERVRCIVCKFSDANAVPAIDADAPPTFHVTDDALDAPDGAVVDGYERHGNEWIKLSSPDR